MQSPAPAPSQIPQLGPGFPAQAPAGLRYPAPPYPVRPAMFTPRLHPPPPMPGPMAPRTISGIPALPAPLTKPADQPKPVFLGGAEKAHTTVYVGKISPTVDDTFLRNVLGVCGEVKNWKRAQDPTTNANKGFGFCEFDNAEGVLRALRLMNKYSLEGSELLINVDKETRGYLERYIAAKENQYFLECTQEDDVEAAPGVEVQRRNPAKDEEAFGIVSDRDKIADRTAMDMLKQLLEDRARNKPFIRPRSPSIREAKAKDAEMEDAERMRRRARREKERREKSEREYEEQLREWEARERDKERARIQELERERERRRERKREVKLQEDESDEDDWQRRRYRASSQDERRRKRQREREEDISEFLKEQQELEEANKRRRIEDAQRAVEKAAEEMAAAERERQRAAEEAAAAEAAALERPASNEHDHSSNNGDTPDNGACDMLVDDNSDDNREKPPPKKLNFGISGGKRASLPTLFKQDDEDEAPKDRKRTLIPIDYSKDEIESVAPSQELLNRQNDAAQQVQMKKLIDSIPTAKEELFNYPVDWSIYDKHKLDQKIRPWVTKKITEFLGEEEQTFIDYILQHTRKHVSAASMLELLGNILDNEAEMFVLKMWKMLIFEIKRIQTGLFKPSS